VGFSRFRVSRDRQPSRRRRRNRLGARSGYTLIEIAMVVILIGILTALMVQHITEVKEHAYLASMQSDLRNLETAEESYFVDYDTYTASLPVDRYMPSQDNTYAILSATVTGWSAQVTRTSTAGLGVNTCHIAVGTAETTAAEWPGAPYCP